MMRPFKEKTRGQSGQALILVLVFFLLGTLTLMPLLAQMGTSLKTGVSYEKKSQAFYAADAGIEDGLWQIKYEMLETLADDDDFAYNYSKVCAYNPVKQINGLTANVTIENCWVAAAANPYATPAAARAALERDLTDNTTDRLVVAGTATTLSTYRIKIDFYPSVTETESLQVESIGIWIPHGFTYTENCNLATFDNTTGKYTEMVDEDSPGGQTVVWDFSAYPLEFTDLPPEELDPSDNPQTAEITFDYTADVADTKPAAIAWIVTAGEISTELPMAWDIDTKYYKIMSVAGDTKIVGYASRYDPREVGAAFNGDYVAIGNSLLTGGTTRTTWVAETNSKVTLTSIPNGDPETDIADVEQACLYWSGSYTSPLTTAIGTLDGCSAFTNWSNTYPSTVWQVYNYSGDYRFRGHFSAGHYDSARYLTLANPIDLSSYTPGNVVVEWRQSTGTGSFGDPNNYLESNDGVTFQISSDNGTTWSTPASTAFYDDVPALDVNESYFYYVVPFNPLPSLFKIRFHLESASGTSEYCNIDDIGVARITGAADTAATFKIGANSFAVTADSYTVAGFEKYGEYAYACKKDVTAQVKAYGENVTDAFGDVHYTGNGVYNCRDVSANTGAYRSYAGWSMIIIYSSPETAGHQLYLYDTIALNSGYCDLDFDGDGTPGGKITGFKVPEQIGTDPNAAKLTCFVGEGDGAYVDDFIAFNTPEELRVPATGIPNAYKLWDGIDITGNSVSSPNNVWNSKFTGSSAYDGIDIDTFSITWASGLLHADDTEAYINLYTGQDNWMLIYMILSVKSKTSVGGTSHYTININ